MKLNPSQAALLQDLGIVVWHARLPAGGADEVITEAQARVAKVEQKTREQQADAQPKDLQLEAVPPTPAPSAAAEAELSSDPVEPSFSPETVVQPIHFAWTRMDKCLLLHPLELDKAQRQFVSDVLTAVQFTLAGNQQKVRPVSGEFRWPQLENSSGDPQRAMSVWLDKHAADVVWLGVEESAAVQFDGWPASSAQRRVVVLEDLFVAISQSAAKQALWNRLLK